MKLAMFATPDWRSNAAGSAVVVSSAVASAAGGWSAAAAAIDKSGVVAAVPKEHGTFVQAMVDVMASDGGVARPAVHALGDSGSAAVSTSVLRTPLSNSAVFDLHGPVVAQIAVLPPVLIAARSSSDSILTPTSPALQSLDGDAGSVRGATPAIDGHAVVMGQPTVRQSLRGPDAPAALATSAASPARPANPAEMSHSGTVMMTADSRPQLAATVVPALARLRGAPTPQPNAAISASRQSISATGQIPSAVCGMASEVLLVGAIPLASPADAATSNTGRTQKIPRTPHEEPIDRSMPCSIAVPVAPGADVLAVLPHLVTTVVTSKEYSPARQAIAMNSQSLAGTVASGGSNSLVVGPAAKIGAPVKVSTADAASPFESLTVISGSAVATAPPNSADPQGGSATPQAIGAAASDAAQEVVAPTSGEKLASLLAQSVDRPGAVDARGVADGPAVGPIPAAPALAINRSGVAPSARGASVREPDRLAHPDKAPARSNSAVSSAVGLVTSRAVGIAAPKATVLSAKATTAAVAELAGNADLLLSMQPAAAMPAAALEVPASEPAAAPVPLAAALQPMAAPLRATDDPASPQAVVPFSVTVVAAVTAAPAAVPAVVVATKLPQLAHDIGLAIARQVAADGNALHIRLDPAELGRIDVHMSFDDRGTLRALVAADSAISLDLLRRDSADLGRALTDAGVRSDSQSFRFEGRGDGRGSESRSDGGQQQPTTSRSMTARVGTDAEIVAEIPDRSRIRPMRWRGQFDVIA